jgi:hypothetical protein
MSERTKRLKTELLAEITAINPGQPHFSRFEKWVGKALGACFVCELAHGESQIKAEEGGKRFELVFDIVGDGLPWSEIKGSFQTYRLLVECKNTEVPTDADVQKLLRDMKSLGIRVAVLVYRSPSLEPSGDPLKLIRGVYHNENKALVIVAVTHSFIMQCLRDKDKKCREKLGKLWRNHLERWLPI